MDLLQLSYFKKTAELEHITNAAASLMISQPALSKMLKSLETELGYPLFDRKGKNIVLNTNGQIFLTYVNTIFHAIDDAKKELLSANSTEHGNVNLSFTAASKMLPQLISGFMECHPQINISVKQQDIHDATSNCDLYVSSSREPAASTSSCVLLKESCVIAISRKHPLADRKKIRLSELKDAHFIIMQERLPLSDITYELCHQAGFEPNIALCCDDRDTIFSMIGLNLGVALIPSITWSSYLHQKEIVFLPLFQSSYRYINMSWNPDRFMSPAVRLMKQYLCDFFQEQNDPTFI
jgi:DNA-binding transcriptional LysR family regulator